MSQQKVLENINSGYFASASSEDRLPEAIGVCTSCKKKHGVSKKGETEASAMQKNQMFDCAEI